MIKPAHFPCDSAIASDTAGFTPDVSSSLHNPEPLTLSRSRGPSPRKRALIEGLRERIRTIERCARDTGGVIQQHDFRSVAGAENAGPSPGLPPPRSAFSALPPSHRQLTSEASWTLGDASLDSSFPPLDPSAVHEVKPAAYADWPAALSFVLRLALRRLATSNSASENSQILWCWPASVAADLGRPYAPGLIAAGLSPRSLLLVEPSRTSDALWALEEGLSSRTLSLVIGSLPEIDLTPARRLSLAAAAGTPCLLLTAPDRPPAASTATRWRIGTRPSATHPFDAQAPGAPRVELVLERCRGSPRCVGSRPKIVEWCHVSHRFRMAPELADRAPREALSGARSHNGTVRAG